MSTTITYDGGPTMTPDATELQSGTARSESRNVIHEILDGPPVYTLRAAGPRAGDLILRFRSEVAARDCFEAHRLATVFTLTSTTSRLPSFRYIVRDSPEIEPAETGLWRVRVPYQGVS